MTLVADADVYDPVVRALQAIQFDIKRVAEIGASPRQDRDVMQAALEIRGILLTRSMDMPSQAYVYQFARNGLTVVLLRWKRATPKDWQQMVLAILKDASAWEEAAAKKPCVISVTARGSRVRPWARIPSSIISGDSRS